MHKTALWVPTQIEQLSILNTMVIIFSHLDSLLLNVKIREPGATFFLRNTALWLLKLWVI